jgi:hypothetical protein
LIDAGAEVEPAGVSLYLPHGPEDAIRKAFSGKVESGQANRVPLQSLARIPTAKPLTVFA